ncbi:MAG TPA: PAS domain S-box protein [Pseudolabrys sp.]
MAVKHQNVASLPDEVRYRLLVDSITDYAIYLLDPAGIVTSWNTGAERFKGYKAGEIIGQHFSRFYTDEDKQSGLPARALETSAREGTFEHEGWRVRKDGSRFWASVIIDPIRGPSGKVIGFAKVTRDLTERHAHELALRQSQEQFQLLVEGVTDYAIFMLDPQGRVTNWNAGAQRIKGYSAAEIVGHHFSQFYTEEEKGAGLPATALKIAEQEGKFEREGWRVRKDGSRFLAHVIIDAIFDNTGDLIGFAKITRDITERKATEAVLLQAQKLDAIGQLTGGIAHDFNNLLMGVLGSLELLRKRLPEDPKAHSLLENAYTAAQRGNALTKRMLAFARQQDLSHSLVAVPALVRAMTELLQRTLGPSVRIETSFPVQLSSVWIDPNQLELAILNLAINGRDAMPAGGAILIDAHELTVGENDAAGVKAGNYVNLRVVDSGSGMNEETLRRATEPFFTTKGVGKGTGLGLSMVHGFAEQSGGKLFIRSGVGMGTTAELWLPVADAQAHMQAHSQAKPKTNDEAAPAINPLTVLAVDDDYLVLTNTVAMLDDIGHTGIAASSAKEALAILRQIKNVDLVVTDQAMPYMSGTQLAEEIKKEWPNLPVILATGYTDFADGKASDLPTVSKPFTQKELNQEIMRVSQR